jgi:hypothetical protein
LCSLSVHLVVSMSSGAFYSYSLGICWLVFVCPL